jgi:hypothetical protein
LPIVRHHFQDDFEEGEHGAGSPGRHEHQVVPKGRDNVMNDWKFSPIVACLSLLKGATSSRAVRRGFPLKDDLQRIAGDPIAHDLSPITHHP